MADAFGLAVNILTAVDYGQKFVRLAWDISNHGRQGIAGLETLDLTSQNLTKIANELKQPGLPSASNVQGGDGQVIFELASKCTRVVAKMSKTIEGLDLSADSRKTRNAIVKAFKFKWNEAEIEALGIEIDRLRSDVILNLNMHLCRMMTLSLAEQRVFATEMRKFAKRQDDQNTRWKTTGINASFEQDGLGSLLIEILSTLSEDGNTGSATSVRTDLMDAVYAFGPQVAKGADWQVSKTRQSVIERRFLSNLRYDSMFDREYGVEKAHEVTLNWVFKHPRDSPGPHTWSDFRQWLESAQKLYWITGKMGSGKSTLMKFISSDLWGASRTDNAGRRCTPYLQKWAQGQRLTVATFYFWAGTTEPTKIQTSKEGLYRTLLYQLLDAYPSAIPKSSPRRWEALCLYNVDSKALTVSELEVMLDNALAFITTESKVCLFIDGLDEFQGSSEDMAHWVKTLLRFPNLKVCVASRPWPVFEKALINRPHLLMEDLTRPDIEKYVRARLGNDSDFRSLRQHDTVSAEELITEIVTKAEGIFLWVSLVCTSIIFGLTEGDRAGELKKRIGALPTGLIELFDRIINDIELEVEPSKKKQAARYFRLVQESRNPLTALILSFVDDFEDNPRSAIDMPREPLDDGEVARRVKEIRRRLNSRCRGLYIMASGDKHGTQGVQPNESSPWRVVIQPCHRSVAEYLKQDAVKSTLDNMLGSQFDANIMLCSAHLAFFKRMEFQEYKGTKIAMSDAKLSPQRSFTTPAMVMRYAAEVSPSNVDLMVSLVDEMSSMDNSRNILPPSNTFLTFAIREDLVEYLKRRLTRGSSITKPRPGVSRKGIPDSLMHYCQDATKHRGDDNLEVKSLHRSWFRQKTLKFYRALLLRNTNPPQLGPVVQWPLLLDAFFVADAPNAKIVSLLLQKGADTNQVINIPPWPQFIVCDAILGYAKQLFLMVSIKDLDTKAAWVESLRMLDQSKTKTRWADAEWVRKFCAREDHS